jgi:hypothetical protein
LAAAGLPEFHVDQVDEIHLVAWGLTAETTPAYR